LSKRAFIPYGRQAIDEEDIAAVVTTLRSDWLTQGPTVTRFEQALAQACGACFAVACSSGTAALHLAAMAVGLGEGDHAVVPTLTFLATANAARYVGAEVVLSDVDPDSGLLDLSHVASMLASVEQQAVKALIPVHLNGQCVDMEAVAAIAAQHELCVIEDACHALGGTYRSRDGVEGQVGNCRYSDLTTFSFHPLKTVAMGEGGAVTTNDEVLYRRLVRLRNHGIVREPEGFEDTALAFDSRGVAKPWYYEMPEVGFNYRASDIHCALGLSQLEKLGRFVRRRRELVRRYDRLLAPFRSLVRPLGLVGNTDAAWHLYVVLIDFAALGLERATLMEQLRKEGIGTQVHYLPVHLQPYYKRRYGDRSLPGAERYYARALSLPLFPALRDQDVDRVVATLVRELEQAAARS
jgi:UDP-4-amino-4,6-dideoxy-N-acetyl-beta-L-altrosamine transaminase